jgi:flagellar hook-associated protein 2
MVGTITSAGIGSGLDVNSIVSQLMSIERQPLDALLTKQSGLNTKISALGNLKSLVATLQTSASGLGTASNFTVLNGTVADSSIASTTVDSTKASSGSYSLNVGQLAQAQILNTAQAPGIVAGTLSISVGSGLAKSVAVGASDSLTTIRDTINADATLKTQIKASVVDNRLVLESLSSGASNTISVAGSTGLSAFDTVNLAPARAAQDAKFTLNGISVQRSTNAVSDALTGVTLNLTKISSGTPTTLTVGTDSSILVTAAQKFVTAFNAVNASIRSLTAYDATTKVAGTLNGDSATGSVQDQLRRALNSTPASLKGGADEQLSKLGIGTATDGSLTIDATKLQKAFDANPSGVAKAMAAYGTAMNTVTTAQIGASGLISGHIDSFNTSVKDINNQSISINYRLTQTEARLKAQFSSLDTLVSSMNSTSSYLTQQLAKSA